MAGSAANASTEGNCGEKISLKDKGNEFFKAETILKLLLSTLRPSSLTLQILLFIGQSQNVISVRFIHLYHVQEDMESSVFHAVETDMTDADTLFLFNRAAAFLQLVKLNKALADAETTITLNPQWEKGYFRKGCVLEAMEQYDDALAAFQTSLQYNPQSTEVSRKIRRISQLAKDKKRAQEVESIRSNVDMAKHLDALKSELSEKIGSEECCKEIFSFLVETMEAAVKSWHETSNVDPRVYFLIDKEKTETDKYAPVVNIDKAFESPHTHSSCFTFLRQYAEETFSKAACLVVPKSIISYPQSLYDLLLLYCFGKEGVGLARVYSSLVYYQILEVCSMKLHAATASPTVR
ncbi:hypothetical protein GH714_004089 [Hevea brasiliensis]|uniref:Uncharacterized protein n=1 Tax=Hevea brasiliensis TaxID=3981 RepID=A0A6A6KQ82_HEVBR|nr:hypothetical protein GH714_004089 [Hevea brasiliensis]